MGYPRNAISHLEVFILQNIRLTEAQTEILQNRLCLTNIHQNLEYYKQDKQRLFLKEIYPKNRAYTIPSRWFMFSLQ